MKALKPNRKYLTNLINDQEDQIKKLKSKLRGAQIWCGRWRAEAKQLKEVV